MDNQDNSEVDYRCTAVPPNGKYFVNFLKERHF